ncbi:hypothetical protein EHS25_001410 [Saitozyma podzolica]|uniref:CFEM domain-containing protein n=1 Tax=Saitozyma podzolica TaxID=1890683 RepID=A0A427YGE9_9TREE|nr:hypothetical protein EHS25_001410 [Saitozyma podzolica]
MKFSVVSALVGAAFVGFASAQNSTSAIPACVITCSTQAATAAGCSSYADATCVCTSATFQNDAGACLVANCTTSDQQAASALQQALCGATSANGSVTNTVAAATASTSINTASLSSAASSLSSSASKAASSSAAASSSTSKAASSSAAATAAASSSKSAGNKVEFGLKGLISTAVAVVGVAAGALAVL